MVNEALCDWEWTDMGDLMTVERKVLFCGIPDVIRLMSYEKVSIVVALLHDLGKRWVECRALSRTSEG